MEYDDDFVSALSKKNTKIKIKDVTEDEIINVARLSLMGISFVQKKGYSKKYCLPMIPDCYRNKPKSINYHKFQENLKFYTEHKRTLINMFTNMWFAIWIQGRTLHHKVGSSSTEIATGSPFYSVKSF